jgi:hypothetical protein
VNDDERQLVQNIAREVLATLRERGVALSGEPRADIHPPIGVCTGDYSQFPELAGKLHGGAPPASALSQPIPLTGIITANQLEAAMKAAPNGVAVLAIDARLTPLANDIARQHVGRIRRLDAQAAGSIQVDTAGLPWLWWIDGSCPVVQEVTAQRRDRLRQSGAGITPAALSNVVRELAGAIKTRRIAGGILFVHNAARATCLANRCPSIRAVVATCGEAVEQGITELGANVLIVEYPHHGLRSISAMVDRLMQQPPKPPPAVERDLADLHRCG